MRSIVLIGLVAACGGATKPANETVATSASSAPAASSSAAEPAETPRQKETKLIVKEINEPDTSDPHMQARIVAAGLSEADYGLPASQVKALAATANNQSVDPSQCTRILGEALEDAKPAVEKRCGGFDALHKRITATPENKRVAEMTAACKITGSFAKAEAWSTLMGAIVADELAADPKSTPDEKAFAMKLAWLCTK